MMVALRAFLFAGLVLHKVVWEILRPRQRTSRSEQTKSVSWWSVGARIVKVTILLWLLIQVFLPDVLPISPTPLALRIVGGVVYTIGLAVAILGRVQLGRNWSDIEIGRVAEGHEVVGDGIYRFVRHPIYAGDVLLLIGLELSLNSWLVLAVAGLVPMVVVKAVQEERLLVAAMPAYGEYARRTKRFIPFVI